MSRRAYFDTSVIAKWYVAERASSAAIDLRSRFRAPPFLTELHRIELTSGLQSKVFRRELLRKITIRENRFGFEPEITAKIAKLKCRIYEVGISYSGRTYEEGKKIGLRDGAYWQWSLSAELAAEDDNLAAGGWSSCHLQRLREDDNLAGGQQVIAVGNGGRDDFSD